MSGKSAVSIKRISTYDADSVFAAMQACLLPLGGIERFVKRGQKVLLKPNLLAAFAPEKAVTTHPSVVEAAARLCLQAGAEVVVGDSPGFGALESVMKRCGLADCIQRFGIGIADFKNEVEFEAPENVLGRKLALAKAAADADVIISLPKLKTHGQMVFTGALKNQFGFVVGAKKAHYHYRLQTREWLAALLIDINLIVKPALAIIDGIVAMEGMGPAAGEPRSLGVLLAGSDLTALDIVACKLINLDPELVPLLSAAKDRRFGSSVFEEIDSLGDDWRELVVPDFKKVPELRSLLRMVPLPRFLVPRFRRFWAPRPRILPELCIKCNACKQGCPVVPPAIDPAAEDNCFVDDERCIRCYCCHEFCPEKAIELKRSWLHRLSHT